MRLERMIREGFDRLYADAADTGRVLVLAVCAWLTGQPFRVPYFERALSYIRSFEGVWTATGGDIVDRYLEQVS